MKTLLTTLLALSGLVFASAASGACSGHGGVSCSAGPDNDGSVICVDGWRNSSVSYASMVKCQGYDVPEPAFVPAVAPRVQPAPVAAPKPTPTPAIPTEVTTSEVTVVKETPRAVPTPGAKPLVTKPVATSSPARANATQKAETGPRAVVRATTTPVIATTTTQNTVVVPQASPYMKEAGVFSVFRKFKFW